ncbi:MAG: SGNH/GDSL hydrolase family protein [Spartobacteria bacterium]|nr:SGNH/GDSL hydrolase family protein [Spartobacteria bacterium]
MNGKKIIMRGLLVVVSVIVALVAVEVGMRLWPEDETEAHIKDNPIFDRSLTFYPPAIPRLHPWTTPDVTPLRIAVIGDSITEGAQVQPYDTYGMRLEALLNMNEGVRPAEVHIYALAGTCTKHQKRFLRSALQISPDIVILGICLNDAEDFENKQQLTQWREERLPRIPPPRVAKWLRRSKIVSWLYQKKETVRTRKAQNDYFRKLFAPDYRGFRLFKRSIKYFQDVCAERGIDFIAVIFPMLHADLDEERYPFTDIHAVIGNTLSEFGIQYLDLLPHYINKTSDRLTAVPGIDGHPNEIGHRIAAEVIFEYLLSNAVIDAAYEPTLKQVSRIEYWNSIRKRVHAPLETVE